MRVPKGVAHEGPLVAGDEVNVIDLHTAVSYGGSVLFGTGNPPPGGGNSTKGFAVKSDDNADEFVRRLIGMRIVE